METQALLKELTELQEKSRLTEQEEERLSELENILGGLDDFYEEQL